MHAFFIGSTFRSTTRLELANDQAKAKQHPEAKFLLFENYSLSLSTLSFKVDKTYSKNVKQTSVSV